MTFDEWFQDLITSGGYVGNAEEWGRSCWNASLQASATDALMDMTPEQRMAVFNRFCTHCGSDSPGCQCWNDE